MSVGAGRDQSRATSPATEIGRGGEPRARRRARRPLVALALLLSVTTGLVGGCTSTPGADPAKPTAPTAPESSTPGAGDPSETPGIDPAGAPGQGGQTSTGVTMAGRPSAAQLAAARREVARLPLPKLAAQLVVPRQVGSRATAAAALRTQGYGGYAVFRGNLPAGAAAIPAARADNAAFSQAVTASGRSWPAFISIDQEGGPVTRLDAPMTPFPAVMALGAAGDPALARRVGAASGAELRNLGYTVVLAPDADVTIGAADPTIGIRSPGSDPRAVARIATALAAGYVDAGILPTLKHFPGHGGVSADTHVGTVRQTATLAQLRSRDLVPFAEAARAGVPAIMTAHIVLSAVDPSRPATVSAPVLTGLLRKDLRFDGLVVTDALEMAAVASRYPSGQVAVAAVQAGADVLLMPADPKAAVNALVQAVQRKTLTRARLEQSAARMVATLRAQSAKAPAKAPGSHTAVSQAVANASITRLGGECTARLVGRSIAISGGSAADRTALTKAARAAGLGTGSGTSVVLRAGSAYRAAEGAGPRSTGGAASGDVVVALDSPYTLGTDRARVAKLATFGRTPATYTALVDIMLGRRAAAGRLPVAVGSARVGSGCGR